MHRLQTAATQKQSSKKGEQIVRNASRRQILSIGSRKELWHKGGNYGKFKVP